MAIEMRKSHTAFQQEIFDRFGLIPNFFQSTPDAPEVAERLLEFAKLLYLDNPIPSLFKERLLVYLSRFCEVRYCIARHCGFLIGRGHSSGDPFVQVQTVAQAIRLLKTPAPWQRDLDAVLLPLEGISTPIDWPEPETDSEDCLFAAAAVVFVQPRRCDRERAALRNAVGGQRFEHLMGLLTFVRAAHYWTMVHPDLTFEDDAGQLLEQHEELAHLLLEDPEAARSDMGVRLFDELKLLRDLNERRELEKANQALEERYREVEMELAHANRVATMGQLSASIAHEVNQPITAAITNTNVALHWLDAEHRDLEKVRQALDRTVKSGSRASAVVDRIRAFVKKEPPRTDNVEINGAIREVVALTRGETAKSGISVHMQLAEGLPLIRGDRVQLQQVLLNLILNAVEAMSDLGEGLRELLITTTKAESDGVLVAVRDSGPGLAPVSLKGAFEPFYTTKPGGLGMGLSICRSIIGAHGGRLWATASEPRGTTFMFTLPEHPDSAV